MLGVKIFKILVPAFKKLTHRQINMVVAVVICEQHSGRVKKVAAEFLKGTGEEKVMLGLTLEGRVGLMVGRKRRAVQRPGQKMVCSEHRD